MVDFVRPNFLGTRTEFGNMFERPIQNGQCVDSEPKDVKLMKERVYVLHSLVKGFVQRRSHAVLRDSLPHKEEHVLFLRMTPLQRDLYRHHMSQLLLNKSVSNPINAFAVCLKIWNHPDILYNLFKKGIDDVDLELDEETSEVDKKNVSATNAPKLSPLSTIDPGESKSSLKAGSLVGIHGVKEKKDESTLEWAEELFKGTVVSSFKFNHFITGVYFCRLHPR